MKGGYYSGDGLYSRIHICSGLITAVVCIDKWSLQQVSLWSGSLKFDVLDCDNPISNGPISLMHISL